jgi:hypothetical protein
LSKNIRYFFPDACKGLGSVPPVNPQEPPPFIITTTKRITTPTPITTTTRKPPSPTPPITTTRKPPTPITTSRTTPQTRSTTTPRTTTPPTPPTPPPFIPNNVPNTCNKDSCCDENKPKLVLPIPMNNGQGKSGGCTSYGTLSIPFEGMDADMLKSMTYGSDVKVILKSILQNLP